MNLPLTLSIGRNTLQFKAAYDYITIKKTKLSTPECFFAVTSAAMFALDALNTLFNIKFPALRVAEMASRGALACWGLYIGIEQNLPGGVLRISVKQGLNIARLALELKHPSYRSRADWLAVSSLDIFLRVVTGKYN